MPPVHDASHFSPSFEFCHKFFFYLDPKIIDISTTTLKTEETFFCGIEVAFGTKKTGLGIGGKMKILFDVSSFFRRLRVRALPVIQRLLLVGRRDGAARNISGATA